MYSDLTRYFIASLCTIGFSYISKLLCEIKIKTIVTNVDNSKTVSTFYIGWMLFMGVIFFSYISTTFLVYWSIIGLYAFVLYVLSKVFVREETIQLSTNENISLNKCIVMEEPNDNEKINVDKIKKLCSDDKNDKNDENKKTN
jgi:hypothetical protein